MTKNWPPPLTEKEDIMIEGTLEQFVIRTDDGLIVVYGWSYENGDTLTIRRISRTLRVGECEKVEVRKEQVVAHQYLPFPSREWR